MKNPHVARFPFRLAFAAALVGLTSLSPMSVLRAQDAAALALPERRALKEYQETKLPDLVKNINAAAKFDVPLDIQWGAIAAKDQGANYLSDDYFTNIFFVPLANALKEVTADSMGADALKAKLKKVVITFDLATAPVSKYVNGVKFESGTLTINFRPFSNAQETGERTKAIVTGLQSNL